MKLCCFFNYNPLYRYPIYYAMSQEFDCDFFFGDSVFVPLKQFDSNLLPGFKNYLKAVKFTKLFVWHKGVSKVLRLKYDAYIITGDPSSLSNWLVLVYAKIFKKKIYCWCHGLNQYSDSTYTKLINTPFYKSMDGIFLYNKFNKKFMVHLGLDESKIHIIYNSLDTQLQTDIYSTLLPSTIYRNHFGNDYPIAIFIGRVQKRMKVELLIEAVDILRKMGSHVNVVIVGGYMDGINIEELVQKKGLQEYVWFYGPSFDEKVNSELLYNANVCVAPGTVGLTAIHSLSYGTPVITHNNFCAIGPEFEAIKPGITGDFFEEDNVESLANVIEKWIGLTVEERDKVRKEARNEILDKWNVSRQIEILRKVIF